MDFFNNLRLFLSLRAVVLAGDVDELKDLFIEMPPIPE